MRSDWRMTRYWPSAVVFAAREACHERWLVSVSSLAFATMLSIVPVALIGLGLFPQFSGYHDTMSRLNGFILQAFVPGVGAVIEQHFNEFSVNATKLPVIGILGLVVSAGLLLLDIHSAFHKIWAIPYKTPWKRRVLELWGLLTLPPILAVGSDWLILFAIRKIGVDLHALPRVAPDLLVLVVFVFLYAAFCPQKDTSWLAIFLGAASATTVFLLAKSAFIAYVTGKSLQNIVYGALAVIPMIQIWLFVFWWIVLFGAFVIERLDARLSTPRPGV